MQRLIGQDIGNLQKWTDTLITGVDALRTSQKDIEHKISVDFLKFKEDLLKVKNDESALKQVER